MARIDVIMPQMGESIAEGTISKWIKQVGDEVKRDEPIFEISTDKVDAEIPAPNAGVLAEILVQQGATVAVNTVVARIETEKGATVTAPAAAPPAPAASPAPAAEPSPRPAAPPPVAAEAPRPARPAAVPPPASESADDRLRRRSTPLVRKIAAEHGIDIAALQGSGHAGRVTKNDIVGYIEGGAAAPAPVSAAPPAARPATRAPRQPLMSRGSIIRWRGQIERGFW